MLIFGGFFALSVIEFLFYLLIFTSSINKSCIEFGIFKPKRMFDSVAEDKT